MLHIVDSDSSQTLAVHEVRRDRNLVIQGPPGTGKSQTIANIIASAIADGKTVLFVAEKMAALDVVKRRLDATGVGDACLELHSNKANKRAVLDELRRTWELGSPKGDAPDALLSRLTEARDKLNAHVARMHHPHETARLSPYQVVGQLARLRQAGRQPANNATPAATWSPEDYRRRHVLLDELVQRIEDIGPPAAHPWCGVGLDSVTPMEADRLTARLPDLHDRLSALETQGEHVATTLELEAPARPSEFGGLKALASRVAEAPNLTPAALAADAWTANGDAVAGLLEAGRLHAERAEALHGGVAPEGWSLDAAAVAQALAVLPDGFGVEAFAGLATLHRSLPERYD